MERTFHRPIDWAQSFSVVVPIVLSTLGGIVVFYHILDKNIDAFKTAFEVSRQETKAEFAAIRQETKEEFAALRQETRADMNASNARWEKLLVEVHKVDKENQAIKLALPHTR